MNLGQIMETQVIATKTDATCMTVAERMILGAIEGLPVIDVLGRVVGVVTEFDLVKMLLGGNDGLFGAVEDVMRQQPICLDSDQTVEQAMDLMGERDLASIPVVSNGRLVAVVSRTDVLRAYVALQFEIVN